MLIDCDRCVVRGAACGGCVVSVLLGGPPDAVDIDVVAGGALDPVTIRSASHDGMPFAGDVFDFDVVDSDVFELDPAERAALEALAAGGLVPPLRLVLPESATG